MVWATVLAVAVARLVGLPLAVFLWQSTPTAQHGLDSDAILGAAALGIATAATVLLIRVGNIIADGRSEVNMLFFASPVLAVALLAWVDDSLQNLAVYLVGAALIVASTTVIQTRAALRQRTRPPCRSGRHGTRRRPGGASNCVATSKLDGSLSAETLITRGRTRGSV